MRRADDPALAGSLYAKTVVTRWALQNRYRVGVTASSPGAEAKWRQLAEELSAAFDVQVIDPGESTVTARLTDSDGNLEPECTQALSRWYGSTRSSGLSHVAPKTTVGGRVMTPAALALARDGDAERHTRPPSPYGRAIIGHGDVGDVDFVRSVNVPTCSSGRGRAGSSCLVYVDEDRDILEPYVARGRLGGPVQLHRQRSAGRTLGFHGSPWARACRMQTQHEVVIRGA